MSPASVADHLWQSTLFAGVAWLLTLALRKNHAAMRHSIWLVASLKFLVPFSLLIAIGSQLGQSLAPGAPLPQIPLSFEETRHTFERIEIRVHGLDEIASSFQILPALLLGIWACGCAIVLFSWCVRWRRVQKAVRAADPLSEGRELEALRRLQRAAGIGKRIELLSSSMPMEPGVFGVFRPALLLPAGIADRLADNQLDAIMAHELCHVRRRDNLAAVIHMAVEAFFWFHPLVWWLAARLVEERERACDEEVLRLGSAPQVYAEGVLQVCRFYVESPLVCVAGITGADLKKRIEGIMAHRAAQRLGLGRRLLLTTAGLAAVCGPVAIGLANAPRLIKITPAGIPASAAFETAFIKPARQPGARRLITMNSPGGKFEATNTTLKMLIAAAYRVQHFQISGGPDWLTSDRWDMAATGPLSAGDEQQQHMLQSLLVDRFKLALRRETKDLPVFALVVAKNGPKIHEFQAPAPGSLSRSNITLDRGQLTGAKMSMSTLSRILSNSTGRFVMDRTGLQGVFDINLKWTPEANESVRGPAFFKALEEQLGLKLEERRGPVEILTIDHAEKPVER